MNERSQWETYTINIVFYPTLPKAINEISVMMKTITIYFNLMSCISVSLIWLLLKSGEQSELMEKSSLKNKVNWFVIFVYAWQYNS